MLRLFLSRKRWVFFLLLLLALIGILMEHLHTAKTRHGPRGSRGGGGGGRGGGGGGERGSKRAEEIFKESGHLFVGIMSRPSGFKERKALRATWLAEITPSFSSSSLSSSSSSSAPSPFSFLNVSYAFFVGSASETWTDARVWFESWRYGDIVFVDMMDSYYGLTRKSLAIFEHGVSVGAECIMKVDDDVYFDTSVLHYLVSQCKDNYVGSILFGSTPFRDPWSKFYVSEAEYPAERYPDYALGPLYLMGISLVKEILRFKETLPLFKIDDVAIGMWVQAAQDRNPGKFNLVFLGSNFIASPYLCWRKSRWFISGLNPNKSSVISMLRP